MARAAADDASSAGATTPSEETPTDVADAQPQLNLLQWVTPALTALIVVLGVQQGEQQRPKEQKAGKIKKALSSGRADCPPPLVANASAAHGVTGYVFGCPRRTNRAPT